MEELFCIIIDLILSALAIWFVVDSFIYMLS